MRKLLFMMLATSALLAMAPAAFARHHRHGPRPHHQRVRHERFTAGPATAGSATTSGVGTVTSFTSGVLVITLANGSTVSGQVTDRTELECMASTGGATTPDLQSHDGSGSGDTSDGGDNTSSGSGDTSDDGDDGSDSTDAAGGDGQDEATTCTTAALVPGAVVEEADLTISSAGAIWTKIEPAS